jgi:hypothetical protein
MITFFPMCLLKKNAKIRQVNGETIVQFELFLYGRITF